MALTLSGCGRTGSTAEPTVTTIPATPPPLDLFAEELLTASGVEISCDSADGATINCATVGSSQRIEVDSNASVFARWRLRPSAIFESLSGFETLALTARMEGDLVPDLYLVESDGDRIPVSLRRAGLREGVQEIRIPLAEIVGEDGARPDFADFSEIQIAFEWADMAGTLTLDEMHFLPVWDEPVRVSAAAVSLADGLTIPDDFVVEAVADGLAGMTQITFTESGEMLVSLQDGRVWWYHDDDNDGFFDWRHLYFTGLPEIVGLLADPNDGSVWVGGRGRLVKTIDDNGDGVADVSEVRVDGLPWGRHQNNGLAWNPSPDPFTGEEGAVWIYFGLGSTGDLDDGGPINSTIVRFPRDGASAEEVEVVSRGNRNAYMVTWAEVPLDMEEPDGEVAWQLFASENGPDFNDAPDEVNHIRRQHHYGFPAQFGPVEEGMIDGKPYSGPLYSAPAHASASGLAYVNNPAWPLAFRTLYVSLFGQVFSEEVVGHTVEGITLRLEETATGPTYRGEPFDFVTGLDRPLPMAVAPDGNLLVGDYATGVIYKVRYAGNAGR